MTARNWIRFVGLIALLRLLHVPACVAQKNPVPIREDGYFYTNPLLDCIPDPTYVPPFKKDVKEFVDSQIKQGSAKRVSVYFRQLNNGYSFGINETWKYSPSGLFKVANLIQVMKYAQEEPSILDEKLLCTKGSADFDRYSNLVLGKSYSVRELLVRMLDNDIGALELLETKFKVSSMWKGPLKEIGLNVKASAGITHIISPQEYSLLFQTLYNASFLDRRFSSEALSFLTDHRFEDGIVAGVSDSEIPIAHFRGASINHVSPQLHETAIVYVKGNPYLLSIMTEGDEIKNLIQIVRTISSIIHKVCTNPEAVSTSDEGSYSMSNTIELLNPLLDCSSDIKSFKPFTKKVEQYIKQVVKTKHVESVSVYFQHLKTGDRFTINGEETYIPASLMKVPEMISLLKGAEQNQDLLSREIIFKKIPEKYLSKAVTGLEPGMRYSVLDLLQRTIILSDNYAADMLFTEIKEVEQLWDELFADLGITQWRIKTKPRQGEISVEQMSLLFRVLYNSTYLSRKNSDLALEILAQTTFSQGIRKGLPENMLASTKYGERLSSQPGSVPNQLHECGIVYYEDNPYLICIMTRGANMDNQAQVIERISQIVYQEMVREFPIKAE